MELMLQRTHLKIKELIHAAQTEIIKKWNHVDWRYRVIAVLAVASLFAFWLGPRWVLSRHMSELSMEALERGAGLVKTLALTNQQAVSLNQQVFYDVETILAERGVIDAILVDPDGKVIAPISRAGSLAAPLGKADQLHVVKKEDGLFELSYPMYVWELTDESAQKRIIGAAHLLFSTEKVLNQLKATRFQYFKYLVFVGLIMMGAVYLVVQFIEVPLQKVSFQLQDYIKGEGEYLQPVNGFHLLDDMVANINKLLKNKRQTVTDINNSDLEQIDREVQKENKSSAEVIEMLTKGVGEATGDALFLINSENQIIYTNERGVQYIGNKKELVGKHLLEVFAETTIAPIVLELASAALSHPGHLQYQDDHLPGSLSRIAALALEDKEAVKYYILTVQNAGKRGVS